MSRKLTKEEFVANAKAVHGEKYNYSKVDYISTDKKVTIICKTHGEFEQTPDNHVNGKNGCPKCSHDAKKLNTETFIENARAIHGKRYNYTLVDYKNNRTKVTIICKTHGEFEQTPSKHVNLKQGCPKCANDAKTFSAEQFIERARAVHGEKYNYKFVNYVNAHKKVTIICKTHGEFKQSPNSHISGKKGCPICNASKGELYFENLLKELNVNFETQKTFDGLIGLGGGTLMFDFYLSEFNLLVEIDGEQHTNKKHWHNKKTGVFETRQQHDSLKNEYAKANKIKLIRINYNSVNEEFVLNVKKTLKMLRK